MFVKANKETNEIEILLPTEFNQYFSELNNDLMEEFAFESISKITVERMNVFVADWFTSRGIKLPEEKSENKNENQDGI